MVNTTSVMGAAPEMRLAGPNGELRLKLVRYQFPEITEGEWDPNWLIVSGQASLDGRSWQFEDPCLTNFEASQLASWLEEVAHGRGEELIDFVEPNLVFRRLSDTMLRVTFALEAAPPWASSDQKLDGELGFETAVGPHLAEAADALRQQLADFPERGRRSDD